MVRKYLYSRVIFFFNIIIYYFKFPLKEETDLNNGQETIRYPPKVVIQPARKTIFTGNRVVLLECAATGPDREVEGPLLSVLKYKWEKTINGIRWVRVNIGGSRQWQWENPEYNGNIHIDPSKFSSNKELLEGRYRCVVSLDDRYVVKSREGIVKYHSQYLYTV